METKRLFAPKTVEVSDVFNNEPYKMTVCVYPHPQTLYFSNLVRRAHHENDIDAYAELLSLLIPDWDIEMDGTPFPPTVDNFLKIPRDFVDHVFEKASNAVQDAQPKVEYIEDKKEESKTAEAK